MDLFFLLQNSKTPWDRDMTRLWLSTFGSLVCHPWDERYISLHCTTWKSFTFPSLFPTEKIQKLSPRYGITRYHQKFPTTNCSPSDLVPNASYNAGNSALVPFFRIVSSREPNSKVKKKWPPKQGDKKVTNWSIWFVTCWKKHLNLSISWRCLRLFGTLICFFA